jgi:hypothetical protein
VAASASRARAANSTGANLDLMRRVTLLLLLLLLLLHHADRTTHATRVEKMDTAFNSDAILPADTEDGHSSGSGIFANLSNADVHENRVQNRLENHAFLKGKENHTISDNWWKARKRWWSRHQTCLALAYRKIRGQ